MITKEPVTVCDICKDRVVLKNCRCEFCNRDLCDECSKKSEVEWGDQSSTICEFTVCEECEELGWDGNLLKSKDELKEKLREIMVKHILASKITKGRKERQN